MTDPNRRPHEDPREEPEADLVEPPARQRQGDEPEDLLRSTDREKAERDKQVERDA